MVYIAFLSPLRDDKTSNSCETPPPKFGENCEFRCHCSNLSEICDRHTGNCFSGCIDGWEGKNCHTIKSIFDKSAINAKPNSSESVQCFIQKLWYSWSNVYLTFHNDTRLLTLINVSQSGNIMSFDNRVNASLKRTTEMEADIVTFLFNFGENDCALTGMYECRFDMVDNFTLLYGNLSMKVQGMSKNLHLSTKKAYLIDSNDKISCNLQLAEPDTEVFLTFTDIKNNTLNSTDVKVSKQLLKTSTAECTNLTTFMYEFNVTTELNQSTVQCIMRNESGEIYLKSNSAVINVVSVLTSVNGVMDPPSHDIMIQNKTELSCYFNVSSFEWDAVRLDFQNDSLASKTIVRLTNSSRAWHAGQINATLKVDSSFVNVTFVLDFATPKDACSLSGIYTCSIEMVDKHIATESDSTSLNFSVPVSDLSLHLLPRYQYGTYDFINCSADTMEPATTTLSLEVCDSDSTFVPFEMYNISFVVFNETGLKNENCSQQILLSYQVLFNSQMNVSLRCSVHDSYRNTALPTSCSMPEISTALVVGVMDPPSHDIMIQNKTELSCYFIVSSFEWDAVRLDFKNESSLSQTIVRLTNRSRAGMKVK
ncbi:uncharacterized protein LOC134240295 [Saccostrea cucullata]|uniref:uncharacterized protein LOC134240295 n=1 Tax=Saccostrea cuccullata TaxID=36930 RepID=UPI002ED0B47A